MSGCIAIEHAVALALVTGLTGALTAHIRRRPKR
jgi:exosortase/archaeosortase